MYDKINPLSFVVNHSAHQFNWEDRKNYKERDRNFIQCLQAMETMMDLDAYIVDYVKEEILYVTRGSLLYSHSGIDGKDLKKEGSRIYEKIVAKEDMDMLQKSNIKAVDFFYNLPVKQRNQFYYTFDFRIRNRENRLILLNLKQTVLDLTPQGVVRLALCVLSYPTNDTPGHSYIKLNNTGKIYEFIPSQDKYIEVKTQQLTPKAIRVLTLASGGKSEAEIAQELGISVNTVKYHKKNIFIRTGTHNTAEAIQWMNNQKKKI